MRELREDPFFENKNDDAHEHVERVLDIVSLFNIPRVTHDAVMLRVFAITLTEAAKRLVDSLSSGTVNSWDLLKKAFIQRLGEDSQGPIPGMTPAQALTTIKTMADHSQKWHDSSSSRNIDSGDNYEEIAAIVNKLDSLAHLDKECLLNEEVKSVEEVKYGEFGRSFPFNNGAKYRVGLPRYHTRVDNRPMFGEKRPSLEELITKHLEESTRRRVEMEEWVKKLQKNVEINTQNLSASLKNLETQIKQLIKEFHTKAASEVPSSSVGQCKAIYANDEAPIDNTSSNGTNELHGVSFISDADEQVA
ncbi:hypothetical protein Tco_0893047 [Tanacetum coccineum]|uniref:Uncharacterized protein n=1 Tax=Tanacetum coccineum TaxID=301880 RepID=A0ABQ5C7N1_9ASTR